MRMTGNRIEWLYGLINNRTNGWPEGEPDMNTYGKPGNRLLEKTSGCMIFKHADIQTFKCSNDLSLKRPDGRVVIITTG